MITQLIPFSFKESLKGRLMSTLHAVPARQLDMANRVAKVGIPQVVGFDFFNFKNEILEYTKSLNTETYAFKYAFSRERTTLYASIYACMIYGLLEEIGKFSIKEKRDWANYFDSFQNEKDGLFYDPALAGEAYEGNSNWNEGWGKKHLAGHIIIAYIRLGFRPKYNFKFLEDYYKTDQVEKWLIQLFQTKNMWTASNYIMNLVTIMQYSRDYMEDQKADSTIAYILEWLTKKQDCTTGLWHNHIPKTLQELNNAIRGAYHYYPLYIYDEKEIKYQDKVIDQILKTQNTWGGFDEENHPSGACEDIDALDPLIRFCLNTNYRTIDVTLAVQKALYWVLSNRNSDGGFSFMPLTPHEYGAHNVTTSLASESNLMATWFRTLCLAYMLKYLKIPNQFDIIKAPGYELPI